MPIAPTYPGVYIEEIPSGVHTITGVGTSITAFIGFTPRGSVNEPVHIFSFADFERAFGGLAVDNFLTYAVKHFFQNGGTEAYVVRVANGARQAAVTMKLGVANGDKPVLDVTAATAGTWGNNLQFDVDYNTSNPASLFNLTVTEFVEQNGQMVPGQTEIFRNLSMNKFNPSFVVTAVNSTSALVTVALPAGLTITGKGKSTSATLVAADLDQIVTSSRDRVAVVVNGNGPFEVIVAPPAGGTLTPRLNALAADLAVKINAVAGGAAVTATRVGSTVEVTSALTTEASAVQFLDASSSSATSALKLGVANGGTEVEGAAGFRPRQTGTTGVIAPTMTAAAPLLAANVDVNVFRGAATVNAAPIPLAWLTSLTTPEEAVAALGDALRKSSDPLLAGATISLVGGVLRLLPGPADPSLSLDIVVSAPAKALGFDPAGVRNVARYGPAGFDQLAQVNSAAGSNGTRPSATELTGDELAKTGIYALEKVDLFNLLVMPDDEVTGSVYSEAIAYCTRRRAFMIIDAPQTVNTFAEAEKWINKDASVLRSRNSALYFPRLRLPDPQMNGALGTFPAAGALAGLYARTDAERGVWKAPAGTTATIVGATGLSVALTDDENGKLNPFGLNCLRLFPVIGTVSWGARTGNGADVKADEYKYIPVRRLALFLEESLYRGTQWVVFEPNDEPLWSQIRLNLGAFMQNLFISGAFQGRTARDAFFVKCDKETTTQNDIDLGRVNIVVGFAPLKPAEFVVIKIQQIAGAIRT